MRRIIGTIGVTLAIVALAGFAIAGLGDGTRTYEGTTQLQGASVELEMEDGVATLVAEGLPEPPSGDVYKAWIMGPGSDSPEPSAAFLPRDGSATTAVPGAEDAEAVLVTRESDPETPAPTEQPVVTIELASVAQTAGDSWEDDWFDEFEFDEFEEGDELDGDTALTDHGIYKMAATSPWNEVNHVSQPTSTLSPDPGQVLGVDSELNLTAALAGRMDPQEALESAQSDMEQALATFALAAADQPREAPRILKDPTADNTDVYASTAPDAPGALTVLANWIPLADPAGGPYFGPLDPSARYAKFDNTGDGFEDLAYRFASASAGGGAIYGCRSGPGMQGQNACVRAAALESNTGEQSEFFVAQNPPNNGTLSNGQELAISV